MDIEKKLQLIDELAAFRADSRMERMDDVLNHRTRYLTVVLENIFQPHNGAAVLRSCECFGLQEVHVIENEHKFKVKNSISMGAGKWLDLKYHNEPDAPNTQNCLQHLKDAGYRLAAGTLRKGAVPLDEVPLDKPLAVMVGHELKGLTNEAHDAADVHFKLPIIGFTQSFNLSVFSALCLYDLTRRLHKDDTIDWQLSEDEKIDLKLKWLKLDVKAAPVIEQAMGRNQ